MRKSIKNPLFKTALLLSGFTIGLPGYPTCLAEEDTGANKTVVEQHDVESAAYSGPELSLPLPLVAEVSSKSETPVVENEQSELAPHAVPSSELVEADPEVTGSNLTDTVSKKSFSEQISPQKKSESNYIIEGEPAPVIGDGSESVPQDQVHGEEKSSSKRFDTANYSGVTPEEKLRLLKRQALLADHLMDYKTAEELYIKLLNMDLEDSDRREILLNMGSMYEEAAIASKTAVIYEKFVDTYNHDPEVPAIFIKLGILYREMGATKMALAKFYNVLNASLNIPQEEIEDYILLSMKAQLEIAETYFQIGDYKKAEKFFSRLTLLDLSEKDQELVRFKSAYTQYLLENYPSVVAGLGKFIDHYPESHLVAESHFLLANSYKRLNRPHEAVQETLNLLRKNLINRESDENLWFYWKKRTGNQLANEFYEQSDFLSALKIYQAMVPLSNTPEWQWPIIYQIGLCFERLRMLPKAREAYSILANEEEWKNRDYELNENLESIKEMAIWRLEHIDWISQAESGISKLMVSSKIPKF